MPSRPELIMGAILIVDDSSEDGQITRHHVAKLAVHNLVHVLVSGEELITYLEGLAPYQDRLLYPYPIVILLDMKMPGMSGMDVLAWLRDHPPHAAVPVLMLTGWSGDLRKMQQAYELGARSFFTKPISAEEFARTAQSLKIPLSF